ncbi:MAG: hypothetical protein H6686_07135 [Fibrobacteria bacterium]|nr:hypothetical protein [Fibrobacteria bacterium]
MKYAVSILTLLAGVLHAQSPSALLGWGRENPAVDGPSRGMGDAGAALRSDKSWDPLLVARSGFNTLTALEVQVVPSLVWIDDGTTSNTIGNVEVPRLSVGIPLGAFGHLGAGYWQRFSRSFAFEDFNDTGFTLTGEGGSFEAVGSYALALPFDALRGTALGLSYHRVMGRDRVLSEHNRKSPDEFYGVSRLDTLETRRDGEYWTASAYYTRGPYDLGGWMSIPGEVLLTTHRGASDQTFGADAKRTVDAPVGWGGAGAWRFATHQAVVARASLESWDGAVSDASDRWSLGAGWQWNGGGDRFDDLWQRSSFRAGALGAFGGPGDPSTAALTAGLGMPMGVLGTIDLSAQVGQTNSESHGEEVSDTFVRLYVSLTGANRWGQSQRKRR